LEGSQDSASQADPVLRGDGPDSRGNFRIAATHRQALTADDPLPLNRGPLKIDEETNTAARSSQIIEALRQVLVSQALNAFQFDHEHLLDKHIREVLTYDVPLVCNR
jgi:hypothetical protein